VDSQAPTVLSALASTNKAYVSGETLQISVTFSENVTVNTGGGTPRIAVDFAIGTDDFVYASGSGTSTLVFSRTLTGTHFDMDGLPSSISSITLSGGTIQDVGTNNAPTTFTAQNMSAVYVTYPQVAVWTQSSFTNMAPPTAPTIANGGSVTTASCGTGTCRVFDGSTVSLSLTGALSGVETVFMVFKTPASVSGNLDIFSTDITLTDNTANFDMTTFNGTMIMNGTTLNPNDTSHTTNLAAGSTNVMQFDFTSGRNYSSETLIGTAFNGAIGEVIAIEGTLTTTQKDNIRNYLEAKY
jgi:hypothetical protein